MAQKLKNLTGEHWIANSLPHFAVTDLQSS